MATQGGTLNLTRAAAKVRDRSTSTHTSWLVLLPFPHRSHSNANASTSLAQYAVWNSPVDVYGSSSKLCQGAARQRSSPPAARKPPAGSGVEPFHRWMLTAIAAISVIIGAVAAEHAYTLTDMWLGFRLVHFVCEAPAMVGSFHIVCGAAESWSAAPAAATRARSREWCVPI